MLIPGLAEKNSFSFSFLIWKLWTVWKHDKYIYVDILG